MVWVFPDGPLPAGRWRSVAKVAVTDDLDAVRDDLAAAVDQAFEPVHVSVWLPGPRGSR
jgi:hypothetical protein